MDPELTVEEMIEAGRPLLAVMLDKGTPDANYWKNSRTQYAADFVARGVSREEAEIRADNILAIIAWNRHIRGEF